MIDIPRTDEPFDMAAIKHDARLILQVLNYAENIIVALDLAVDGFDDPDAHVIGRHTGDALRQIDALKATINKVRTWL